MGGAHTEREERKGENDEILQKTKGLKTDI